MTNEWTDGRTNQQTTRLLELLREAKNYHICHLVFDEEGRVEATEGPQLLHSAHHGARGGGHLQPVQAAVREAEAHEAAGVPGAGAAQVDHLWACLLHPPSHLAGGQGVEQP